MDAKSSLKHGSPWGRGESWDKCADLRICQGVSTAGSEGTCQKWELETAQLYVRFHHRYQVNKASSGTTQRSPFQSMAPIWDTTQMAGSNLAF